MRELNTVANRGYTLAFHEGRLTNYAHDYEQTESLAQYEYAGVVVEQREDAFIIQAKNKLEAGDVLEMISPVAREIIRVRLYEFEDANTGEVRLAVHGGQRTLVRVPFELFDQEDPALLRERFPAFTVLRKERPLTEEQWRRVQFDETVQRLESAGVQGDAYERDRDELIAAIGDSDKERHFKTRRVGTEGCCGKGCNGCLMFWQDPAYARAREVLLKRKQGSQLSKAEAAELKLSAAELASPSR
jgi:putative protease